MKRLLSLLAVVFALGSPVSAATLLDAVTNQRIEVSGQEAAQLLGSAPSRYTCIAACDFTSGVMQTTVPVGSAVALTSGVDTNIATVSIAPGTWGCRAEIATKPAGTTTQGDTVLSVGTVSAALAAAGSGQTRLPYAAAAGAPIVGSAQATIVATAQTTVYATIYSTFSVSTNAAYATITCERK